MVAAALVAGEGCRGGAAAGFRAPAEATRRDAAGPRFKDMTARAGIAFRYNFGDFTYDNILESVASRPVSAAPRPA